MAAKFIPLNKLKKSPKNARKMPHGDAAIEGGYREHRGEGDAAKSGWSEPEVDTDGALTGCYPNSLAKGGGWQLLRVKRKEIKKTGADSLYGRPRNQRPKSPRRKHHRNDFHPADQFEVFGHRLKS